MAHGQHRDFQIVAMAAFWFKIWPSPGFLAELRGYVHGSVGIHLSSNWFGGAAILRGKQQLPPNVSAGVGVVPMVVDEEASTFTMLLMVSGITPDQLTSAEIHVGSRGQIGPPVVNLGPPSAWQRWPDGSGMTRFLVGERFPQQFLPQLRRGETYVNLATRQFPQGEIRDQLTPVPGDSAPPIQVTGYNAAVIAGVDPAVRSAQPFDSATFAWFESGAIDDNGVQHQDGLPVVSTFTSATGRGAAYQIQPADGNNVL
jgi:hypothetical protein